MSNSQDNIIGEMGFDSSLFSGLDDKLTNEEFKERISSLVKPILSERFPNDFQKQQIAPHHDRVSIACPYCGDSMKMSHKKRGNFILKGKHANYYKCHNCSIFKRIDSFFKDFKIELKLDAINYVIDNIKDFGSYENSTYDMSVFLDMDYFDKFAIDRQVLKDHFKLVEIKGSAVSDYLKNRLQFNDEKFLYSPSKKYLLILNLTTSGKILGAQKRLFSGTNRFETYKLSKLYEAMNLDFKEEPDKKEYLDTMSTIFNICLVTFNHPITLFEGPMDAFLFKNSIANTGANKEIPLDIPLRFFYDSDETGKRKSIQHINKQHEVFLWLKLENDLGLPSRKKWDINDFFIWAKKENITIPLLDNYFSSDGLDIIDI